MAAGKLSRPSREEFRKRKKDAKRAKKRKIKEKDRHARNSTGIRNLQLKQYKDISIILPPITEQKRIVAKLDRAFIKIDNLIKQDIEKKHEFTTLHENYKNNIFDNLINLLICFYPYSYWFIVIYFLVIKVCL